MWCPFGLQESVRYEGKEKHCDKKQFPYLRASTIVLDEAELERQKRLRRRPPKLPVADLKQRPAQHHGSQTGRAVQHRCQTFEQEREKSVQRATPEPPSARQQSQHRAP